MFRRFRRSMHVATSFAAIFFAMLALGLLVTL